MATYNAKLDKNETAASLKAKMTAFELLYGESDFYIQHGLVWIRQGEFDGRGRQYTETLSLWEPAAIEKVQGKFIHIRWRADDAMRTGWVSKMYLPSSDAVPYSDPLPELYFITKR